jgi:nucleoside 2-deoxyribosyltransferase
MEKRVYLAGPINGLNYNGCNDWREHAIEELAKSEIVGVSPMRFKKFLDNGKIIKGEYGDNVLSCSRGVTTRDRFDVINCDIMLANLIGCTNVTIGTMIEYGWADMARKPIITIIEKSGNVHDHPMLRELTGFRVDNLEEGLYIAKTILRP